MAVHDRATTWVARCPTHSSAHPLVGSHRWILTGLRRQPIISCIPALIGIDPT